MQSLYLFRGKLRFAAMPNVNMRFSIVFLCIIVYLTIVLPRTSALLPWTNNSEESICTELVPKTTTLFVSYLEVYVHRVMQLFPRLATRINYKIDHQHSYYPQKICCKGYKEVSNRCTPICSPECVNSICKAPDLCECSEGYEKESINNCRPICFDGCLNGICVQPNVCECFPNYWIGFDGYNCRLACDENCMFNHGHCMVPNICICDNGYKESNGTNICEPICESECVNGKCVKPNVCSCDDGYASSETSAYLCEPICGHACGNGTCIAPNICKCDEGFVLQEDNVTAAACKPLCTSPCGPYSECTALDCCTCKQGYRTIDKNDTTDEVLDSRNTTCISVCVNDCLNGKPVSPNVCDCNNGYLLAILFIKLVENSKHINYCQAVCKKFCTPNGKCDASNSWEQNESYQNITTNDDKYVCQPFCESNCENGICTDPNVCTCNMGYERDERNLCVPVCYPPCTNGTCNEPNICSCEEGFTQRNGTICEPFCENACTNGTCVAPNTCQCNENFVEIKSNDASVCVPECSRNCSGHGTCLNQLNTCHCFYGWTGWDCDETNVCVYKTSLNSHLLSSVTVINETNSTMVETYDNAPLCYQCSVSLNNETLCLAIQSDESLTIPTVVCFFSTKLLCYKRPHHNVFKRSIYMTVSLIGVAITVVAGYAIVHKRKKQKFVPANIQAIPLDTPDTEILIII